MKIGHLTPIILAAGITLYGCSQDSPTAFLETDLAQAVTKASKPATGDDEGSAQRRPGKFLDLAEDQQAEIQALRKAQSEQKRTILEVARREGVDRAEIQKRLEPLEAAFDTGLKAILTPEQLTAYEEAVAAKKDSPKPHGRKGRKGKGNKALSPFKALDLTEAQQAEIKTLMKAIGEQKRPILETARSEGVDRAEIQKRLEPLEAAFDTGLKAILTPEQLTQLEEAKAASKDRAKPHSRKGRKGKGNKALSPFKALDLTEAQQAEIKTLMKAIGEQKRPIMETARSEGVDRAEIQKRLEPLEAAFDTGLKAILTPEQLTQLEEAKAASKDRAKPHGRNGRKGPRRGPKHPADPPSDAL